MNILFVFIVLIGPDMKVHLLIDFPVLLQKQWVSFVIVIVSFLDTQWKPS